MAATKVEGQQVLTDGDMSMTKTIGLNSKFQIMAH